MWYDDDLHARKGDDGTLHAVVMRSRVHARVAWQGVDEFLRADAADAFCHCYCTDNQLTWKEVD